VSKNLNPHVRETLLKTATKAPKTGRPGGDLSPKADHAEKGGKKRNSGADGFKLT